MSKSTLRTSPLFNVLAFTASWAIQIFVCKLAFIAGAQIIPFSIQSALITLAILAICVLPTRYPELLAMRWRILLVLLAANAIHFAGGGILSNAGTALTSAINAGFLVQFTTVTTTLLAWLILGEALTKAKALTIVLIILGSFLLLTNGHLTPPRAGDLLILAACLCWSTGNVIVRKVLRTNSISGDTVSLLRPIAGLPIMFLLIQMAGFYPSEVQTMFEQDLFDLSYLKYAVANGIAVALLFIFLNRTLKIASASYLTMMSSLTPVMVAILAVVFLHESLSGVQLAGALVIVISSFSTQLMKVHAH